MFVILMIRWDDMMNRERKQRNRELLLKIEAMKEMDVRNDVIHNGGINESRNEYDEYKEWLIAVIMKHVLFEFMMDMKRKMSEIFKIMKHMN